MEIVLVYIDGNRVYIALLRKTYLQEERGRKNTFKAQIFLATKPLIERRIRILGTVIFNIQRKKPEVIVFLSVYLVYENNNSCINGYAYSQYGAFKQFMHNNHCWISGRWLTSNVRTDCVVNISLKMIIVISFQLLKTKEAVFSPTVFYFCFAIAGSEASTLFRVYKSTVSYQHLHHLCNFYNPFANSRFGYGFFIIHRAHITGGSWGGHGSSLFC